MRSGCSHTCLVALVAGALLPLGAASAQGTPPRAALTFGVAAGRVGWTSTQAAPRNDTPLLQAALGVVPARGPVEFRGELGWLLGASATGPVSATANALVPATVLRLGPDRRLQAYLVGGVGAYGVGSVGPALGANAGTGARLDGGRAAVRLEVRRHWANRSYGVALGVDVRRLVRR